MVQLPEGWIRTPEFRCNYPALLTPREDMSGKLKYGVEAVFYDSGSLQELITLVNDTARSKFGPNLPAKFRFPLRRGEESSIPEYQGKVWSRFRTDFKIPVYDRYTVSITDENLLYPGMWGRALVSCRTYSGRQGQGVTFYLQAFQKTRDDEPAFQRPLDEYFKDDSPVGPDGFGGPGDYSDLF
jgi:hypothetical protein